MLYISFFFTVTLVVYALFTLRAERRERVKRRLSWISETEPDLEGKEEEEPAKRKPFARLSPLFRSGWRILKKNFGRRLEGSGGMRQAVLENRLLQAGRPFGMGTVEYRMLQIALFFTLPLLFGGYSVLLGAGAGGLIGFGIAGIAGAAFIPSYYLSIKVKQRSRQALRELPDVLDLLTVSLEAGLGFDAALSKLVSRADGVLSEEFRRCLEEIRLGKTRREALLGVKDRLAADELRLLISSILQAEKLGIGLVQVLRVQSHEVREQRRQRAEEAAMKAPIKMLFPLVLFIFPTLFIVILGPAVIQFIEAFTKK